ncbi:MAG: hypothetical protein ABW250_24225 [Pyrinomonadaceae bacterium]
MTYQGPMLIKEPELRWPVILAAAIITFFTVLMLTGVVRLTLSKSYARTVERPQLAGAQRPGMPEFERLREKIIVEQLTAADASRPPDDFAVEMNATVRNTTDRTLSGLEMKGRIVDERRSVVRERSVVVIPSRQTVLEPGEAIRVRILLDDLRPDDARPGMLMEVTAIRID